MKKYQTVCFLLSFLCLPIFTTAADPQRPNIVLMMMDNLGWGELGVYGGGELRGAATPRLDKLASEGLQLLNFNVESICSSSRSALLTGRHAVRSGTWNPRGNGNGLERDEITIAELLSKADYMTGLFGKWHLGKTPGYLPTDQGFDYWYGTTESTRSVAYPTQLQYDDTESSPQMILRAYKDKTPKPVKAYGMDERRSMDSELVQEAINFMQQNVRAKKSFFAELSFTQPHYPTLPHKDFAGKTGNGNFADVLAEIDYRAGQVLDAIKKLGIEENTIIIWTSDNGPEWRYPYHGSAGVWRGNYYTALEGSLRVPFLIRWPNKIKPGGTSNEIVHLVDLLPTLAKVADQPMPDDRPIDGVDQLDFFLSKQSHSNREGFPIFGRHDKLYAYKWRNWKIHYTKVDDVRSSLEPLQLKLIYNLLTDPKEEYEMGPDGYWVLPIVQKKVNAFNRTLENNQ